jgi:hypothetical protein
MQLISRRSGPIESVLENVPFDRARDEALHAQPAPHAIAHDGR